MRTWLLPVLAGLLVTSAASAQTPAWKFRWQTGQILTYRVEQLTTVTDQVEDATEQTKTKLNLTKRWQVLSVDPAGTATLQMSLTALRSETTRPNGDVLLFDSAKPEANPPDLQKALSSYVGPPLAVIRVDALGRVIEVKESKFGPASRFEAAPPFVVMVAGVAAAPGQSWERPYNITLEPPAGTGEKYPAVQRYVVKEVKDPVVVLTLTTEVNKQPEAVADRLPLLQSLPEGEAVFDIQVGLLRSAHLHIDKVLDGHNGENSKYHFESTYTEEYVGNQ